MNTKTILGLDLGTNSIGWALIEIEYENKIVKILGLGSRILTMDAAEVAKFENSVDKGYADVPLSDFIINDIFYRVNQQKSAMLATDILDNIVNEFGLRKRGVFGANFAVLRGSNSPSILVEIGFVTNSGDMSTYGTDSSRVKLASEIAQGVRKHFE